MTHPQVLLQPLLAIHDRIRDDVVRAMDGQEPEYLSAVRREDEGDTIYAIDVVSEDVLVAAFEELSQQHSFVLVAEGLDHGHNGQMVFPAHASKENVTWRIIVDPIDGTRG